MSLSLCLYVCCKHRPLYQIQIFKIPISFYNARRQQSSRTVELVDYTYDGRRVARRTHTSVDRNTLTALLRSRMGLLCSLFLQLCSSWQDFVKCADARTTRSLVIIKVDRSTSSQYCASAFSAVSSRFFKPFSGKTLTVAVLFCCCLFCITLLSQ